MLGFISTDRAVRGPGGMYMQRWFEESAEAGLPWTPEKQTIQVAPGSEGFFIDKDDLIFTLDPAGGTVPLTVELEGSTESVSRNLPAGTVTAAYTAFIDPIASEETVEPFDFATGPLAEAGTDPLAWQVSGPWLALVQDAEAADAGGQSLKLVADPTIFAEGVDTVITAPASTAFEFDAAGLIVEFGFSVALEGPAENAGRYEIRTPILDVGIQAGLVEFLSGGARDTLLIETNVWYRIDVIADYTTRTYNLFIDGAIFAVDVPFAQRPLGQEDNFDGLQFALVAGSASDDALFIDDVFIKSRTPETADVYVTQSTDYGENWTPPLNISTDGSLINQGVALAAAGDRLMAVWRRFSPPGNFSPEQRDAIMYAIYEPDADGVFMWSTPQSVTQAPDTDPLICPLDLRASEAQFRGSALPTLTTDGTDFYVFWSDRSFAVEDNRCNEGFGRVVMSVMDTTGTWTAPAAVDDANGLLGHQFMPNSAASGGKVQLAWYDTRFDESGIFDNEISDRSDEDELLRHTADVRAARIVDGLIRPSINVTQYQMGMGPDEQLMKLERSFINGRIFKKGTQPFIGDYLAVVGQDFRFNAEGEWEPNQSVGLEEPTFFIAWTSNRDIRGNVWLDFKQKTEFTPATAVSMASEADPADEYGTCEPEAGEDLSLTRDQNVYGAMLYPGLRLTSPTPIKPADDVQRGFVIYLQNFTDKLRRYEATILNQPTLADGSPDAEGRASFSEFPAPPFLGADPDPVTSTTVVLPAQAAAVKTVYITSSEPRPRVEVQVVELDCDLCQSDVLVLNGNPDAPDLEETAGTGGILSDEIHDPLIANRITREVVNPGFRHDDPTMPGFRHPGFRHEDEENPSEQSPGFRHDGIEAPGFRHPGFRHPGFRHVDLEIPGFVAQSYEMTDFENPGFRHPGFRHQPLSSDRLFNQGIANTALEGVDFDSLTDVTWVVTNRGNTVGSFDINPFLVGQTATRSQLLVTKTYAVPTIRDCEVVQVAKNQVLLNIPDPDLSGADIGVGTMFIEPGETINITLRLFNATEEGTDVGEVGLRVAPQSCDTNQGCASEDDIDPVLDPEGPPTPVFDFETFSGPDVTFDVSRPRYDRRSRQNIITVRVTNNTELALPGEFRVVVEGTSSGLVNADGQTDVGEDFVNLVVGDGSAIEPGQTVTTLLRIGSRSRRSTITRLERKLPSFDD